MNSAELALSQTGSVLGGRYLLLRVIGTGGMGAVFEAEHTVTKRRVALKVIHRELLDRANVAERFLREAQAPAALRHPSIVEVLDAGQEPDGQFFLVFDLLEGITLHAALKQNRIHPIDVIPVCVSVLSGLAVAHAKGLVHRDIKPGNIFLVNGSIEQVKLLDFGIAKEIGDGARQRALTAPGAIVGTARYMSPEQAGGREIDGRADLWAVGAILYRTFTGSAPFSNQSFAQHISSLIHQPIPPVRLECPLISEELGYVIDRALEREPADRWQSAEEMRQALEAIDLDEERRLQSAPVRGDIESNPWDRTTTRHAAALEQTEPSSPAPTTTISRRLRTGAVVAWGIALATLLFLLLQHGEDAPLEPKGAPLEAPAPPPPPLGLEEKPVAAPPPPPAPAPKKERKRSRKRSTLETKRPAEDREVEAESPWSRPKRAQESPWTQPKREFKADR